MTRHVLTMALALMVIISRPVSAADRPDEKNHPLFALSEFTAKYHEKPDPAAVPAQLKSLLTKDVLDALEPHVFELLAQSFGHMGRGNARLVRLYESEFSEANLNGKVMLVRILRVCGDADSLTQIKTWESSVESRRLKRELASARQLLESPKRVLPRDQSPNRPEDLDLLWADFLVTGDYAPVSRILDVLDGPDQLRTGIEAYLKKHPDDEDREELFTKLADLDLLQPGTKDKLVEGNLERHLDAKTLPKAIRFAHDILGESGEKLYSGILLRGSASWSLQSNAKQHPRLAQLLKEHESEWPAARQAVVKELLTAE